MEYERQLMCSAILGKIEFELTGSLDKQQYYCGRIHFDFTAPGSSSQIKPITRKQFEQFKKFYEKYNEDIKYTCQKFDFNVECTYHDSTGRPRGDISFNLDFVYSFMERHIIDGFVYPGTDDERILFDPRIKKLK